MAAFGYPASFEHQANGWRLVRIPDVPEALTEGETEEEAREQAVDCVIAALEGYIKAGRPIPRPSRPSGRGERVALPSLVTAKLAVYETMRSLGWSRSRLACELEMPENAARRLLDLRHSSRMQAIDEALAAMHAELPIGLPSAHKRRVA